MERSRAAIQTSAGEGAEPSFFQGEGTTQSVENNAIVTTGITGGKKAQYHCNYCNKDITGKICIKCAICADFDLCVECFSVGAEVYPHKSNHPYMVRRDLSFPLFSVDWSAEEEILLLEGIDMFGYGNWSEVAEHVGTKSRVECIEHYNTVYINSPCFPLPDMSRVMGNSRQELLAMASEQSDIKKGAAALGEVAVKEESQFPIKIKVEDQSNEVPVGLSSASISSVVSAVGGSGHGKMSTGAAMRASIINPGKDDVDVIKEKRVDTHE